MKRDIKLYNMILPPFILIGFMPWFFGVSLVGNFLIDSAVLIGIMLVVYRKFDFALYKRKIFALWGLGFAADFIGLFFLGFIFIFLDIELTPPLIVIGIVIGAVSIFFLDFFIVFRKVDMTFRQKFFCALAFAVLTAPYTFLLRYFPFFN